MIENIRPNELFEDYVFHSLIYYQLDDFLIPDGEFDRLCRSLLSVWPQVTHPDKALTDRAALRAGTGYQMLDRWPQWAIDRAIDRGLSHWWLKQHARRRQEAVQGFYSGIGSRETPQEALQTMRTIGRLQCNRGRRGRSGGAPGADTAFHQGALESPRFEEVGFDIFLPNAWLFNREEFGYLKPNPDGRIYDVTTFTNYEDAKQLALEARGSFEGLRSGGIALHSRNPYQILGRTLRVKSEVVIFWAQPVGKKGLVKGGTNTAVQVARRHGIPLINLYTDEDSRRAEHWIATMQE